MKPSKHQIKVNLLHENLKTLGETNNFEPVGGESLKTLNKS